MKTRHPCYFDLGASLYTPCNHPNLQAILQNGISGVRSMVFCLEDAVRDDEIIPALTNLKKSLQHLDPDNRFRRFIRPRNPIMLAELLRQPHIDKVDTFIC